MPKGFGGSSDMSGFFSGVYGFNKDNAKAQQAASDQDAADRWANGIMSDAEWLSYIEQRVIATTADPKEHQKWVTAQRKYGTVVADNVAESAYKEGGSINDLIAHYQNRQAAMTPNSNESRELSVRINALQDQRAGDGIQDKTDALLIEISKGTKTYGDLAAVLRDGIAGARDNSDLKEGLEKQLKQVNEQIRSNKVEGGLEKLQYQYEAGKLSGAGYAKALRQQAVQFKDNDPQRYYQLMTAATKLAKSGGTGGGGGGGGGSRGGGGGGGSSSGKSIDALQAKRNRAYVLIDAYERGATSYDGVALTPAKIRELDLQVLKTHDQLSAAYVAKGDKSAAEQTNISKSKYLTDVIVKHNSIPVEEQFRQLNATTGKKLKAALTEMDPQKAMNAFAGVAADWEKFSTSLTKNSNVEFGPVSTGKRVYSDKDATEAVDQGLIAGAAKQAAAFRTLSTEGIDDATAGSAIDSLDGTAGHSLALLGLEVSGRKQGFDSGELVRIATPDGIKWVETHLESQSQVMHDGHMEVSIPKRMPNIEVDGVSSKLVDIFVDINGRPTKIQAVAEMSPVKGMDKLVASRAIPGTEIKKGDTITQAQLDKLGKLGKDVGSLLSGGYATREAAVNYWKVITPGYTDQYGRKHEPEVWAGDTETNVWYKGGLPIRNAVTKDNLVSIGNDGEIVGFSHKSFATAGGVPAIYSGSNAKEMQNVFNANGVDVTGVLQRDYSGNITGEIDADANPYWKPTATPTGAKAAGTDSWWDDGDRRSRSQTLKSDYEQRVHRDQMAAFHGMGKPPEPVKAANDPMAMFNGMGKSLGINLEGTKKKTPTPFAASTKFSPGGAASIYAPKKASAPTVSLPPVTKATYSGPAAEVDRIALGKTQKAKAPVVKAPAKATTAAADKRRTSSKPKPKPKPVVPKEAPIVNTLRMAAGRGAQR